MANLLDIKSAVTTAINNSNSTVQQAVVTQIVGEEVVIRTKALLIVMAKREDNEKKLNKIRPAAQLFDVEGKPLESSIGFTSQQVGERKKLQEKLQRIDSAYNKAFPADESVVPDWEALKKISQEKEDSKEMETKDASKEIK